MMVLILFVCSLTKGQTRRITVATQMKKELDYKLALGSNTLNQSVTL